MPLARAWNSFGVGIRGQIFHGKSTVFLKKKQKRFLLASKRRKIFIEAI